MAKGKASAHALKQITYQLKLIISTWHQQHTFKRWTMNDNHELPPFYQMAALRGQGVLLTRFFGSVLQKTQMEITPNEWLSFWQDTVVSGGFITDFLNRVGWLDVLSTSSELPTLTPHTAQQYYCILLDALMQQHPTLLDSAVDDYFLHLWRQRFPTHNTPNQSPNQQLRHKLLLKLRLQHRKPIELKESFSENNQQISFSLKFRCKSDDAWQILTTLERPRLKTARIAAYEHALQSLR